MAKHKSVINPFNLTQKIKICSKKVQTNCNFLIKAGLASASASYVK